MVFQSEFKIPLWKCKADCQIHIEMQKAKNSQDNLLKIREFTLPTLNAFYKDTLIKTV